MTSDLSVARELAVRLAAVGADEGLDRVLAELSVTELAALAHEWRFWARPKQIVPADARWRSFGVLAGRGFGKTRAISEHVQEEAASGRAMRIALCAQTETKTIEVMIEGESGLLSIAPPWCRPEWRNGRIVWPNGAQAFAYTPEAPGVIRGPEHHLVWCSEFIAWPAATRDEALSNLRLGLRLGYGRLVWDSTPKRKHPTIRWLLERASRHPELHRVVRGATRENVDNITPEALAEWEDELAGTQRGREELDGEYLDDADGSLFVQEWIDRARRDRPTSLVRRILTVDPAISSLPGRDRTGFVDLGLGVDGQVFVLGDMTARYAWEAWGALVVAGYFERRCDCVVVERNKGGDAPVANLRACGRERGVRVEVLAADAPTRHVPGVLYVKEVYAQRQKEARAEPVATLYERGRVSHVKDVDLTSLEATLTTWVPEPDRPSPDDLDALVHGVWELAGLRSESRERRHDVATAAAIQAALTDRLAPSHRGRDKGGGYTPPGTATSWGRGGAFGGGRRL